MERKERSGKGEKKNERGGREQIRNDRTKIE